MDEGGHEAAFWSQADSGNTWKVKKVGKFDVVKKAFPVENRGRESSGTVQTDLRSGRLRRGSSPAARKDTWLGGV